MGRMVQVDGLAGCALGQKIRRDAAAVYGNVEL